MFSKWLDSDLDPANEPLISKSDKAKLRLKKLKLYMKYADTTIADKSLSHLYRHSINYPLNWLDNVPVGNEEKFREEYFNQHGVFPGQEEGDDPADDLLQDWALEDGNLVYSELDEAWELYSERNRLS